MPEYRLPAALIIMDGYGIAAPGPYNAIDQASTPFIDSLYETCSHTTIQASGESVGLPEGQMGNSEVGHLNIGAGRIVRQELTRINLACRDGSIADNEVLNEAIDVVKANGSVLHFMGLLSDGGVHSSNEHLYALLRMASESGVPHVHIHCFLDGRDVPPKSGLGYVEELLRVVDDCRGSGCDMHIASIEGRYYAMDRDNRWERVERAFRAIATCEPRSDLDPVSFVEKSYADDVTDEFVIPASFTDRGVENGDAVVFFNFRPDRAREITHCFCDKEPFDGLNPIRPHFVCLTEYDPDIKAFVAFPKTFPDNVLADVVSSNGLRQYHIAETEKYAHVTFFFNGGREEEKEGEKRVLIPSPKVATYDLQPEMSAPEVAETLSKAIDNDEADVYIVNFANCDMVGHTGVLAAATKAVEAVDAGVATVVGAIKRKKGVALLTADHGNADVMVAEDGQPHTAHTTNPVPLVLIDCSGSNMHLIDDGSGALCDIAPTLLEMAGIDKPVDMDGKSLLA